MIALRSSIMVVLLLGSVACGADEGPTTTNTGGGSPSPAATSADGGTAAPLTRGALAPGRYTFPFSGFDVAFSLGEGWQSQNQAPQAGFQLIYGEVAFPPDLTAITIFTTPLPAQEIPNAVRAIKGVTVESTSIGGPSGTEMLISIGGKSDEPVQILEIGNPPVERYFLVRGNRARLIIIADASGQALMIAIEGPEAGFEDFNSTAQEFLSSFEIT